MRNSIAELAQKITRLVGNELELVTAVPNLTIYSIPAPTPPTGYLLEPSVCVILQGTKRVFLGEEDYSYAIKDFLVTSVDLPLSAEILKASSTEPYVGLTLKFDRKEVASILLDTHIPSRSAANNGPGIGIGTLSRPLFDAFRRLVELIEEPENVTTLSPLIQKEIIFRLLSTEAGRKIRQIATAGNRAHVISHTITQMKANLSEKLHVKELAESAGMSESNFHHQFRSLTTMSPLQFHKRLRLNEARQLMLVNRLDAATAAFEVGYESPSQFSREYSRLFGNPPLQDMKILIGAKPGG